MSDTPSRRGLWLPLVALVVSVGAAVVALAVDWGAPPPESGVAGDRLEARGDPGGTPPEGPPPVETPPAAAGSEDAGEAPEPGAKPVVEPPEGVVPLEGEGIVGIVVDARGEPVSRARIRVSPNLAAAARGGGAASVSRSFRIGAGGRFGFGREAGVTDRQGRFAIRDPGKGSVFDVSFTHPDHPEHTVREVAWTEGTRIDLGVIRLPEGGVIFGFVRDEAGRPVSGARVRRTAARPGSPSAVAMSSVVIAMSDESGRVVSFGGGSGGELTDADGYFEIPKVAPGSHRLVATATGKAEASRDDVVVREGSRTGPIALVLGSGREVAGVVVDETGAPISGASVTAILGGGARSARTDDQGAFSLTGLPEGKLSLMVHARGVSARESVKAGDTSVRIVLSQGLVLAGNVVDAATGAAVNRVRVTLLRQEENRQHRRSTFAMNGTFRMPNLKPGDYTLEVTANGYRKTTVGPYTLVEGRSIEDILVRLQPE